MMPGGEEKAWQDESWKRRNTQRERLLETSSVKKKWKEEENEVV